jgi:hypothetical protein
MELRLHILKILKRNHMYERIQKLEKIYYPACIPIYIDGECRYWATRDEMRICLIVMKLMRIKSFYKAILAFQTIELVGLFINVNE